MTKEVKAFKYWVPIVLAILSIFAYVWSSATRFQAIDSLSTENREKIEKIEKRVDDRLIRIENKLDMIQLKMR